MLTCIESRSWETGRNRGGGGGGGGYGRVKVGKSKVYKRKGGNNKWRSKKVKDQGRERGGERKNKEVLTECS